MIDTIKIAVQQWSDDDGSLLAAGVSYYLAIAFFPLLLILVAGLGFFFQLTQSGQSAESQLLLTIEEQLSPALRSHVETVFAQVREKASVGGPIGVLTLIAFAIVLFTQFDAAFDRIWNIPRQKRNIMETLRHLIAERAKALLMMFALGVIVVAVFLGGIAISTMQGFANETLSNPWLNWTAQSLVSFALNFIVFTLIYRFVPKVEVHWRAAVAGGLCGAVMWEVGRLALSSIVIGQKFSAYGVIGAFLAIMVWAYYAVSIVLFGAEFAQVVANQQFADDE